MRKYRLVSLVVMSAVLTSCNYIFHPSKYYDYSNNKISRAKSREDFRAVRKELHFRPIDDISYDYYRLPQKIKAPDDSAVFVKYVKEILFTEFKKFNVDSIDCEFNSYSDSISVAKGGREHIVAGGRMWVRKNGKLLGSRRFHASCLPSVRGDIVQIQTFYHLKF